MTLSLQGPGQDFVVCKALQASTERSCLCCAIHILNVRRTCLWKRLKGSAAVASAENLGQEGQGVLQAVSLMKLSLSCQGRTLLQRRMPLQEAGLEACHMTTRA